MSSDGYTRENENRLSELKDQVVRGETLSQEETSEMSRLEKKHKHFVEEGERQLRQRAVCGMNNAVDSDGPEDIVDLLHETMVSAGKAMYFWGSLVASVVPGYFGRKVGLSSNFLHWNFISDRLILGALPVITKVGSSGNHLVQIREQLESRNLELGLVLACLEDAEIDGFGIQMISFANESSWREYVTPNVQYIHLPMTDTTADISFHSVVNAVEQMNDCITNRNRAVYVHCKAGKGRSWMVTMCYLTTHGGMNFEEAEELVRGKRPQINPSPSQRAFASQFASRVSGEK